LWTNKERRAATENNITFEISIFATCHRNINKKSHPLEVVDLEIKPFQCY